MGLATVGTLKAGSDALELSSAGAAAKEKAVRDKVISPVRQETYTAWLYFMILSSS